MKFFIDFEATQYGGRIISIGCVSETGKTYNRLCKPSKTDEKITPFITNLTGITQEMIDTADSTDDVFNDFFDWIINVSDDTIPEYYSYGDGDKDFLDRTIKYMKDVHAITFATSLKSLMIDYSKVVANYFGLERVGLKRVYNFLLEKDEVQQHHALEDAIMLRYVAENLTSKAVPEDVVRLPAPQRKVVDKDSKIPDIWFSWKDGYKNAFKVNTCPEGEWTIECYDRENGSLYFNSAEVAVLWLIKYYAKSSPKKTHIREKMLNRLEESINKNKPYFGFQWKRREENE